MNKLLKVSWKRLLTEKVFFIAITACLIISACIVLNDAPTILEWHQEGEEVGLENCYYNFAPLLGLLFASVISIFLGTEYSDGTLRNKLIAGHSRTKVFISFFEISAIACIIITVCWLVGGLLGLHWFNGFNFGWKTYFKYVVVAICCAVNFAAVFTTISMLVPNKAVGAVSCLIIWFIMLFIGSAVVNGLLAPKMIPEYSVASEALATNMVPNPEYISGITRSVFEFLKRIIPVCPTISFDSGNLEKPLEYAVTQIATTVVVLISGCALFRKKDLK